MSELFMS